MIEPLCPTVDWQVIGYMPESGVELKDSCIYHYWIDQQGILCAKTSIPQVSHGNAIHVTIDKNFVNCQECLELLHS